MTKNSPFSVMGGIVGFLFVFGLLGALGLFIHFQSALGQEKDTPDVLKAIAAMEFSRGDFQAIASNPNRFIVKDFRSLKAQLEQQGWIAKEQFGALRQFEKGNEKLNISCSAYTSSYLICTLHPQN